MSWNHRILAHENKGEIYFQIHEVMYNEEGVPDSYTENPVSIGGESLIDIKWTLIHMWRCTNKPVLWAGEKFPLEYEAEQT